MIADYGAQAWVGVMFGIGSLPANFYVALLTDEPGDGWDGSVVATLEPADTAYARQAVAITTGFTLSDNGFVINAANIAYPTPIIDWGNITHFALLDAATNGNLWSYGAFLDAIYIPAGYPASLGVGSIYHGLGNQLASIAE